MKDELFSGDKADIKRVNNSKITGRLLFKTLEQYIEIINND